MSLTENCDAFTICFCITKRKRLTLLQTVKHPTAHLTSKEIRKSQTSLLHRSEKPLLMRNHILAQKAWTVSETSVNLHPTTNHQEAQCTCNFSTNLFACLTPALQGQQKARAVGCSHCPLPTTGKAPPALARFFRRSCRGKKGFSACSAQVSLSNPATLGPL